MTQQAMMGIDYVRPPELKFKQLKKTKDYVEYEIETFKSAKEKASEDPFLKDIDSLIYCHDKLKIKVPSKSYMKQMGKAKFAYAFGMFPNPKNKKASYLDGCILGALGLKRQGTLADVICFITPDISEDDKKKLEVVFDKVIYVPYISPYKMPGDGELETIMMDPDIFQNCNQYDINHPYSHVFFKLHIFNPDLFPYEKVCFVDSDLVPLNYYDSLFMLNTPAGWVENRKKFPWKESFHWDRCDFVKHGEKIPPEITDVDAPSGADVNAGLMVVSPNKWEYNEMIQELTSPLKTWMGPKKKHKGFWTFDFDKLSGRKFIGDSYCYPEQNYLTKRYSGEWTYIEFSFQSWSLDPCNSFGIHMAALNPKPWFKQPIGNEIDIKGKYVPYLHVLEELDIPSDLPKALVTEDKNKYYENISYSYEIFNDLMIWGFIRYQKLIEFFMKECKIYGPKTSFDRDLFEKLSDRHDYLLFEDIKINSTEYKKLSLSQRYICNFFKDYEKTKKKLEKKYLSVCLKKKKNRYGEYSFDPTIISYPLLKYPEKEKAKSKKTKKRTKRKSKKKTKKKTQKITPKTKIIYFYMKNCKYCLRFNKIWNQLKKNKKRNTSYLKINGEENIQLKEKNNISKYPTIIKMKGDEIIHFKGKRTPSKLKTFIMEKNE